jgi:hypothetical protein
MPDPNLRLLEEAATQLAPFLREIVFVGGVTLGLLITDKAAAPIRSTDDVDVIAEILTYVDYIAFSERPVCFAERPTDQGDHSSLLPGYQDGSVPGTRTDGLPGQPRSGRLCRGDRWKKHDTQRDCRFSKRCSRVCRRSSSRPFGRISFSRCGSWICSRFWARAIDSRAAASTGAAQRITAHLDGRTSVRGFKLVALGHHHSKFLDRPLIAKEISIRIAHIHLLHAIPGNGRRAYRDTPPA